MSARRPKFEVYSAFLSEKKRGKHEWHWRLIAGNGEILASGEGFTRKGDANRAVAAVKSTVLAIVGAEVSR